MVSPTAFATTSLTGTTSLDPARFASVNLRCIRRLPRLGRIKGGAGSAVIFAGQSADTVIGGAGSDLVVAGTATPRSPPAPATTPPCSPPQHLALNLTIVGFRPGIDQVEFSGYGPAATPPAAASPCPTAPASPSPG